MFFKRFFLCRTINRSAQWFWFLSLQRLGRIWLCHLVKQQEKSRHFMNTGTQLSFFASSHHLIHLSFLFTWLKFSPLCSVAYALLNWRILFKVTAKILEDVYILLTSLNLTWSVFECHFPQNLYRFHTSLFCFLTLHTSYLTSILFFFTSFF